MSQENKKPKRKNKMKNNQPKRINKMNNNQPKNNQPKNKNFSIVVSKETLMKLKKIQLQETEKHFENGGESPLTLCETIEILLEQVGDKKNEF